MKKMVYILLMLHTVLAIDTYAQTSTSAQSIATVKVIQNMRLTKVEDMNFGRLAYGSVGTVYLSTTGERNVSGLTAIGESGWKPARFEVSGTPGFEYYIGLPSDITLVKDGSELLVEDLVAKPSSASENGLKGVITSNAFFTVGGKLVISSPNLPAGNYHASFEVSVGYN